MEPLEDRQLLASLAFTAQPTTSAMNIVLSEVDVSVTGATAEVVVTVSLGDNPGSALLGGTVTRRSVGGVAKFTDLVVYGGAAAQDYSLVAYATGMPSVESSSFDLKGGSAALNFLSVPSQGTAGANLGTQAQPISVQMLDANGTPSRDDSRTVVRLTIDKNPAGARFVGTDGTLVDQLTATLAGGVATFPRVALDRAGFGYTLRAVAVNTIDVAQATSNPFAIEADTTVAGLVFGQQPTFSLVNTPINTLGYNPPYVPNRVSVLLADRFGNPVETGTAKVQIALATNAANAKLLGNLEAQAVNGVATFDVIYPDRAGSDFQLVATSTEIAGATTLSTAFNVGDVPDANRPIGLKFLNTPTGPVAGGGRLDMIKVQVVDSKGNPVTNAANIGVTLTPTGNLYGATTVLTDASGVATFSNVYAQGRKLIGASTDPANQIPLQAEFDALGGGNTGQVAVSLTYGKPTQLIFATNAGGAPLPIDPGTAGKYLTASNNPIEVWVLDADGNIVQDSNAEILLGVNRATPNEQTTLLGDGSNPGDPSTMKVYASAKAVNGRAVFDQLYINRASVRYQLAAGAKDLALSTFTTAEFDVVRDVTNTVSWVFQPDVAVGSLRQMPGFGGVITLAVTDRVGNVDVNDNSTVITLGLVPPANAPSGTQLKGVTSVQVHNGRAVFDAMYVDQIMGMAGVPGYHLSVTTDNPAITMVTPSNAFTVNNPPIVPIPTFVDPKPSVTNQVAPDETFNLTYLGMGPNGEDYTQEANVTLTLVAESYDNPPANGAVLVADKLQLKPSYDPTTKLNTYAFTNVRVATPGRYRIRAVEEIGAVIFTTNVFQVGAGAALLGTGTGSVADSRDLATTAVATPAGGTNTVTLDLGSYTQNFDYVTDPANFPTYSQQPDGSPQPLSQRFRPPSRGVAADEFAAMVQPNVTPPLGDDPGFTQAPQTTDWWSSIMFQRITAVGIDQRDQKGNRIFPIFSDPFAAMINTQDANSPAKFAGLGLSHLTKRFVNPTLPYLDKDLQVLPDERYPGNAETYYTYSGNLISDQRLYQDLAIGLNGLVADATVLRYSDWTVTLDWDHQLEATMGQGLPFVYFKAKNLEAGQAREVKLVSAQTSYKSTTLSVIDRNGNPVAPGAGGTGPFLIRVQYQVQENESPNSNSVITVQVDNSYGVFLPSNTSWTLGTDGSISATITAASGKDFSYFATAALPESDHSFATFETFRKRAYSFVTGSQVAFSFDEKTGEVFTTYSLQTEPMEQGGDLIDNQPIQALYQHQWRNMDVNTPWLKRADGQLATYQSARGTMRLFDGGVFVTSLQHRGALPFVPPLPNDGASHANYWNTYLLPFLVANTSVTTADSALVLDKLLPNELNYFDFQALFGASQLIPILQEISQSNDSGLSADDKRQADDAARRVFELVKGRMSAWLSAVDDQAIRLFYYQPRTVLEAEITDKTLPGWQTFLSLKPGFLSSEDINDQHLIHGYLLKTAAILSRYDTEWGQSRTQVKNGATVQTFAGKLGEMINRVIRNVSNPRRDDPEFPFLRNFDVFQGHSWADGSANDPFGNNQESASEALNYASGLIQWGEAVGDVALRDLGVYLYTTEIDSFNTYYFNNIPSNPAFPANDAFPPEFTGNPQDPMRADNRPSISLLYGSSAAYRGFIGLIPSAMAGIQMLPLNGASYYLGRDPQFVLRNYAQASSQVTQEGAIPYRTSAYLSVILPYYALANPDDALTQYLARLGEIGPINPNNPIDNVPFNIHWINVLQRYGVVDPEVTADTTSYTVFIKTPGDASTRTFIAHNPSIDPRVVTFFDQNRQKIRSITVPPRSTLVADAAGNSLNTQGSPDYSTGVAPSRFFFSNQPIQGAESTYSFLVGRTGLSENAVNIPGANTPDSLYQTPHDAVTFVMDGLNGQLVDGLSLASFQLWFDPQFSLSSQRTPVLRAAVNYDPTGDGSKVVTHYYNNINLSNNPGYTLGIVNSGGRGGLIGGIAPYPASFVNGKITVQIWCADGNSNAVRLRTDAVGEQGRVSFIDLPYIFTTIGGQDTGSLELGVRPLAPPAGAGALLAAATSREPNFFTSFQGSPVGHTFTARLSAAGSTATLTGNASSDTLALTALAGFLRHNRFTAGDPGFASDLDFDSDQPGEQRLAAARSSRIEIDFGGGTDAVVLGSRFQPASALLARISIVNGDVGADSLVINDQAVLGTLSYVISGSQIRTLEDTLSVTLHGAALGGGVALTTGGDVNSVLVLSSRGGQPISLDTQNGLDLVTIGDGDLSGLLADVTVKNRNSFSDLVVDNSRAVDFSNNVIVTATGITGLAPAAIRYAVDELDDIEIYAGIQSSRYTLSTAPEGSYLYFDSGIGQNLVVVGNGGVIDDQSFPAPVLLEGNSQSRVVLDNTRGTAKSILTDLLGLRGMTSHSIEFARFGDVEILLGGEADVVTLFNTISGTNYTVRAGGGDDRMNINVLNSPLVVEGQDGDDQILAVGDALLVPFGLSLNGGAGNDRLVGGPRADTLAGGPGQDSVFGGSGDDLLLWNEGDGDDLLEGGGGIDLARLVGSLAGADVTRISPGAGGERVQVATTAPTNSLLDLGTIEELALFTQGGADFIEVTPLPAMRVQIDGGAPGVWPGDQLVVRASPSDPGLYGYLGTHAGRWTFQTAATIGFSDIETYNAPVPVLYVKGLYQSVLKRDPDIPGLTFWVIQIDAGASRELVAQGFWRSAEHRGLQVDRLYQQFLDRPADASGRAYWVERLMQGVGEYALARALLTSSAYAALNPTPTRYVDGLYRDVLGRSPNPGAVAYWVRQGARVGRAGVADQFLHSLEASRRLVGGYYDELLGRAADAAGLNFWSTQLTLGRETPTRIAERFLATDEFLDRARTGATERETLSMSVATPATLHADVVTRARPRPRR